VLAGACNGASTHTADPGSPRDAVGPPTWQPHRGFPMSRAWSQVQLRCKRSSREGLAVDVPECVDRRTELKRP
jgi:hypothetical protein